jgi:hypothetical protein
MAKLAQPFPPVIRAVRLEVRPDVRAAEEAVAYVTYGSFHAAFFVAPRHRHRAVFINDNECYLYLNTYFRNT